MKSVIMGHFFCSTLNFIKSSDLSFIYRQKSHIPQPGDIQPTEPPCVFSKLNKPAMMWIITPRLAEAFFFFNRLLSHCSSSQCCIVLLTLTPSALYFSPDGGGSCFQSDGSGIKECWTSICQLASYTEFRQILIEADQGGGRVVGVGGVACCRGALSRLCRFIDPKTPRISVTLTAVTRSSFMKCLWSEMKTQNMLFYCNQYCRCNRWLDTLTSNSKV